MQYRYLNSHLILSSIIVDRSLPTAIYLALLINSCSPIKSGIKIEASIYVMYYSGATENFIRFRKKENHYNFSSTKRCSAFIILAERSGH